MSTGLLLHLIEILGNFSNLGILTIFIYLQIFWVLFLLETWCFWWIGNYLILIDCSNRSSYTGWLYLRSLQLLFELINWAFMNLQNRLMNLRMFLFLIFLIFLIFWWKIRLLYLTMLLTMLYNPAWLFYLFSQMLCKLCLFGYFH
jgi:hypothetical protein